VMVLITVTVHKGDRFVQFSVSIELNL
jgi:hypothetical protein